MAYRKLGRDNKHRRSMLATMTKQVVMNESITTTETRAKEVRKAVEKMVTYGKKGDLVARRKALAFLHNDTEVVLRLREDGCFYNTTEDSHDIFFVTEKQEGWINIFRGKDGPIITGYMFVSKEAAEESSRHCNGFTQGLYLATVKVEWEE